MFIRNAVVPVAGLGTRMLPATKSQPKEMLPVGKKPIVQYVIEELNQSGIERVLFVTGRSKHSIENHFDFDNELMRSLREGGKEELIEELEYERMRFHFFYTRQRRQRGLGDAILCARHFAGDEPFAVALGDSIIGRHCGTQIARRLADCFKRTRAACVIAVEEVPREMTPFYGVVKPCGSASGGEFRLDDLIEKPSADEAPSNLAIAARYVFTPEIFDMLEETAPGKGGEIQLTDAIRLLVGRGKKVWAVKLEPHEKRYDIGNFKSYFETLVDFLLNDPEYGGDLRVKAKEILDAHR